MSILRAPTVVTARAVIKHAAGPDQKGETVSIAEIGTKRPAWSARLS
jgi:hypothetical protein